MAATGAATAGSATTVAAAVAYAYAAIASKSKAVYPLRIMHSSGQVFALA